MNSIKFNNFNFQKGQSAKIGEVQYSAIYFNNIHYKIITSNCNNDYILEVLQVLDSLAVSLINEIIMNSRLSIDNIQNLLVNIKTNKNEILEKYQSKCNIDRLQFLIKYCGTELIDLKEKYEIDLVELSNDIKFYNNYVEKLCNEISEYIDNFKFKCDPKQQERDYMLVSNMKKIIGEVEIYDTQ